MAQSVIKIAKTCRASTADPLYQPGTSRYLHFHEYK